MSTKIHSFIKGMHSNFDEQNQPDGTYREAYNWVRKEDGSLTNESGTISVPTYPANHTVIGSCVLGEEVILFSHTDEYDTMGSGSVSTSVVGVLDKDNVYINKLSTAELGFTENTRLMAVGRVDYRGHRIVYFCSIDGSLQARRLDLDDVPTTDIGEKTITFLESRLPMIGLTSVTETGNIPSGIYQFSARLVTSGSDRTTVGLMTSIIPITNEATGQGVNQFDGALPQTSSFKSINLAISNIDTKYKFIEIICTTYDTLTNTPKSNVVGIRTINGSTLSFTYSSLNQNGEELTLDDLTVEPIEYSNPKTIEQKDGRLILGNLTVKRFNPEFQAVANNIVAKYIIKELDYYEIVDIDTSAGVDNGGETFSFNNYKGESYTTDFKGYQRDEVYSFAITPIFKGNQFGYSYHIPGEYKGEEFEYSADTTTKKLGTYVSSESIYPTGYGYPSGHVRYHKMPNMSQEPIYNGTKIRALGIEFSNILIDDSDIIGYAITRELRTDDNKSILAQGIVNPLVASVEVGSEDKRIVSPWSGKASFQYIGNNVYKHDEIAFYSPETTIYGSSMSGATHIKAVALLQGRTYMVGQQRSGSSDTRYAHMFMNYSTMYNLSYSKVAINRNTIQYVPAGVEDNYHELTNTSASVRNYKGNGFLFLKTNSDLQTYVNMVTQDRVGGDAELTVSNDTTAAVRFQNGGFTYIQNQDDANNQGDTRRTLFNVIQGRTNQYGDVLDKEYILVAYKMNKDTSIECYGGDTFINKTALVSTTKDFQDREFRTMSYFFCESTINTAYRHYIPNETIAYYPKVKKLWTNEGDGILQVDPKYGHANGYNKQYSFENIIKKFYSKQLLAQEEVTRFSNRVIYSQQAIEGEQSDAYRLFLTNNYHDVPKSKGEITNIFTQKNTLYIHTEQSIWKAFFNEHVTQITTAGEVALGNGGIFSRLSMEVFPMTGGYAGSKSPLASCNTPYGYFFIDDLQKKVFCLSESFDEVDMGMGDALASLLPSRLSSTYDYETDRWILSGSNFTISFCPKLKSWSSWHTYRPTHMTSVNQKVLIFSKNNIGILNRGSKGSYFGEEAVDSTITIITNENPLITKSFDNIAINSVSPIKDDTFSEIKAKTQFLSVTKDIVVNDDYDYVPMSHEQQCVRRNDEYRLAVPIYEDDLDESRLKGKWGSFKLSYYNLNNYNFVVKYINVTYRPVAR